MRFFWLFVSILDRACRSSTGQRSDKTCRSFTPNDEWWLRAADEERVLALCSSKKHEGLAAQ